MSRPSWRRKLEEFRRHKEPLGQAIDKGLRYAEDLELIVQEFIDQDREMGGDTGLARRALKLLDRGGTPDHGDEDDHDGCRE